MADKLTLSDIRNTIYKRGKTNANDFTDADLLIALNTAYGRINSIIRKFLDNYRPTFFTAAQLTAGTAEPVLDAEFCELLALWPIYSLLVDDQKSANGVMNEIILKEKELKDFYGTRNYQIATVTIASPAVFTKIGHGLSSGDRISMITTGALPTGLAVDTWYYITYVTDDTFRVSATNGGTVINTSGSQSGTHYYYTEYPKRMEINQESNK